VSADGVNWTIFNASPDLRQQIANTPDIDPLADNGPRNSPIEAVVLANAEVDHIAGLINLREHKPFRLYAHQRILDVLAANSVFNVLDPELAERRPLPLLREVALSGPDSGFGRQALEAALRRIEAERYHSRHPVHKPLHGGKLNKGQVQAWALNRYYYQAGIPRKDLALMSNMHDKPMRLITPRRRLLKIVQISVS
jgi:coenzyme PQQ biosynthesis protein B